MEVLLAVLAMIVVLVGIDAGFRLDERRAKSSGETPITTDKIVVDMTDRDRD
jgi:hypothetical protein